MNTKHTILTEEQKTIYEFMVGRKNILITGLAGTGKTFLLKYFIDNNKYSRKIGVTSTTGISSLLLDGQTLHSYLGIGLGQNSLEYMYKNIKSNTRVSKKWKDLDCLIIDEISMLSPELFDKLESLAKLIRNSKIAFGGIQLILCGDFLQLPCVNTNKFCFESEKWDECIDRVCYMTKIMRQEDYEFCKCLGEIRIGKISEETINVLEKCRDRILTNEYGIKPTKIFCTNADIDYINESELDILGQDGRNFFEYDMKIKTYETKLDINDIEKYKKNCIANTNLQLCLGTQVMLLHNYDFDLKLVNGSKGVIIDFVNDFPIVQFSNGIEEIISYHNWDFYKDDKLILTITQIPLKIAYAVTVHKTQGSTLDYIEIDMKNIFEYGQFYVAFSRARDLDKICIRNLNIDKIKAHPKAVEFYEKYI